FQCCLEYIVYNRFKSFSLKHRTLLIPDKLDACAILTGFAKTLSKSDLAAFHYRHTGQIDLRWTRSVLWHNALSLINFFF
ncbi:MAG: hypothetical protein OEV15_09915, partial [Gallionella sp.]|nr:hypothetical protein [Gallionella sp.]